MVCGLGFGSPHSYRGYYDEVAFELWFNTSIKEMLLCVNRALTETFIGWKGGEFTYNLDTLCHIAYKGHCSENDEFTEQMLLSIAGID